MAPDPFEPGEADPPDVEVNYWREFALGVVEWTLGAIAFGVTAILTVQATALAPAFGVAAGAALLLYGVAQVVFVVPLAGWRLAAGKRARATGVLFMAGLAFSFNALCWGGVALIGSSGGRFAG